MGKDSKYVHHSLKRITLLWNQRNRCIFRRVLRPWRPIIQNLCSLWRIIRPLSHALCPSVCPLGQKNWKHVDRSSKRTTQMKTNKNIKKYSPTCFKAKSTAPRNRLYVRSVVKFSRGKWSQFSSGIKVGKHNLISFCSWPWLMITKANKDTANRKYTSLFYDNVNCTSKAKASDKLRSTQLRIKKEILRTFCKEHPYFPTTHIISNHLTHPSVP